MPKGNIIFLIFCALSVTVLSETAYYVDSEYNGWISTGAISTPFRTAAAALSTVCEIAKDSQTQYIFFTPRSTEYSITSPTKLSNCGAVVLKALPSPYRERANIKFQAELAISKSIFSFDSLDFSIRDGSKRTLQGLLIGNSSDFKFVNCSFNSSISQLHNYFLYFTSGYLGIYNSTMWDESSAVSNRIELSKTELLNLEIQTQELIQHAVFEFYDSDSQELDLHSQSQLKASNISIKSYSTITMPTAEAHFLLVNTNAWFDTITLLGNSASSTLLTRSLIISKSIRDDHTLEVKNLIIQDIKVKSPIITFTSSNHDSQLMLDSIRIKNSIISAPTAPFQFYFEKNGLIQIKNIAVEYTKIVPEKPTESTNLTNFFQITNNLPLKKVLLSDLRISESSVRETFLSMRGSFNSFLMEHVTVKSVDFHASFFSFQGQFPFRYENTYVDNDKLQLFQNISLDTVNSTESFFSFTATEGVAELRVFLRQLTYFDINNMTVKDMKIFDSYLLTQSSDSLAINNRPAFFKLSNIGIKIHESYFDNFLLEEAHFIHVKEKMVPVWIKNSSLSNFYSGVCRDSRFFWRYQNDYSLEVLDENVPQIYPVLTSFVLANNNFTGHWFLEYTSQIFALNVPNAFIVNNTFERTTFISENCVFCAHAIYGDKYAQKMSEASIDELERYLVDQELRHLVMHYISQQNSEKILSSLFIFDHNIFSHVTVYNVNLITISKLIPTISILLVKDNIFTNLLNVHDFLWTEQLITISVLLIENNPNTVVKNNFVASTETGIKFFEARADDNPDTEIEFSENTFRDNLGLAVMLIKGEHFSRVVLSKNTIRSSWLSTLSLISISALSYIKHDLIISDMVLEAIHLNLESYVKASLLSIVLPLNNHSNIVMNNFTLIDCQLSYAHSDQGVSPRSSMIHVMNPKTNLLIESSLIQNNSAEGSSFLITLYSNMVQMKDIQLHSNPSQVASFHNWESTILVASNEFEIVGSAVTNNKGIYGGVFQFENLFSKSNRPMKVSSIDNLFSDNTAELGGVFYFDPLNAKDKPIELGIVNNTFINNSANLQGGTLFIKKQYISHLLVADCIFYLQDESLRPGALFYLEDLSRLKTDTESLVVMKNLVVYSNVTTKLWRTRQDRSLIFFSSARSDSFTVKLRIQNFTIEALYDGDGNPNHSVDTSDSQLTIIKSPTGNMLIDKLHIRNVISSSHLIKLTSNSAVNISDSIFESNTILPYRALHELGACIIGVETSSSNIWNPESITISNTTFFNNSIFSGDYEGSIVCLRSPVFRLALINSNRVVKNMNGAPVFLSIVHSARPNSVPNRVIMLSDSIFEDNSGDTVIRLSEVILDILNCSFLRNTGASRGGAISLMDVFNLNIRNTSFISNSIEGTTEIEKYTLGGGAIFIGLSEDPYLYSFERFQIIDSKFIQNQAVNGQGGAIFIGSFIGNQILSGIKKNNTFQQNSALAGKDISTRPTALRLIIQDKKSHSSHSTQMKSGDLYPEPISHFQFQETSLNFTLFDYFENSLSVLSKAASGYSISLTNPALNETITSKDCTYGSCILPGASLLMKGQAYENVQVRVTLTLESGAHVYFKMHFQLRGCQIGEINSTTKGVCTKCEPDSFSLRTTDTKCHECPNGFKCLGGSELILKKGFWRLDNSSDQAYACHRPEVCNNVLNTSFGDSICSEGYAGPKCLGCDLKNFYRPASGMTCTKCWTSWVTILALIGLILGLLLFEIWFIWKMRAVSNALLVENRFNKEFIEKITKGGYLLIFLQYAQILAIIKNIPSSAIQSVQNLIPITNPYQIVLSTVDCACRYLGISEDDVYYWKLGVVGGLPFLKILLFAGIGGIVKYFHPSYHFKSFIAIICIGITLIEQPGIIYVMISIFSCQPLDPQDPTAGPSYLTIAPNVTCGTPRFYLFRYFVALPLLIFWGVLIPLAFFFILFKNRLRLKERKFAVYFGSTYSSFTRKHYMWAQVQMLITIAMTVLSQVGTMDHTARGLTIVICLVLYFLYLKAAKPYRFADLYKADLIATSIYIVTTYFAVYGAVSEAWLNHTIGVLVLILNLCFIIFMVVKTLEIASLQKFLAYGVQLLNHCFCGMLWNNPSETDFNKIQHSDSIASNKISFGSVPILDSPLLTYEKELSTKDVRDSGEEKASKLEDSIPSKGEIK